MDVQKMEKRKQLGIDKTTFSNTSRTGTCDKCCRYFSILLVVIIVTQFTHIKMSLFSTHIAYRSKFLRSVIFALFADPSNPRKLSLRILEFFILETLDPR